MKETNKIALRKTKISIEFIIIILCTEFIEQIKMIFRLNILRRPNSINLINNLTEVSVFTYISYTFD